MRITRWELIAAGELEPAAAEWLPAVFDELRAQLAQSGEAA